MEENAFKVYKYRWVMLGIYMLILAVNQLLWITFAPITRDSSLFYGVTDLDIAMLSMCFMIVYIIISIPASWIIDTYGIKIGVGIGAALTGIFGFARYFSGHDYNLLLISQIGIAIGQPFLLNAITKTAARWFKIEDRATIVGLATLSTYIGILLGLLITPYLFKGYGMEGMLKIYGIISIASATIYILLSKEKPATSPCLPEQEERSLVFDGLKNTFRNKNFHWLMIVFFVGLGVFNCITTWIEEILRPRGFNTEQAGLTGGLMIIGGILGALIMPILSDYLQKRKAFIIFSIAGAIIGLIGVTFTTNYTLLLVSGATLGFFLLSAGPIGFQYGAEITYPTSEGTSNGLLLLAGQISGILFIFGMDILKNQVTGSMLYPLVILIILTVVCLGITTLLTESPMMKKKE